MKQFQKTSVGMQPAEFVWCLHYFAAMRTKLICDYSLFTDKGCEGGGCWCSLHYLPHCIRKLICDYSLFTDTIVLWILWSFQLPMILIFENSYGVKNYSAILVPSLISILKNSKQCLHLRSMNPVKWMSY